MLADHGARHTSDLHQFSDVAFPFRQQPQNVQARWLCKEFQRAGGGVENPRFRINIMDERWFGGLGLGAHNVKLYILIYMHRRPHIRRRDEGEPGDQRQQQRRPPQPKRRATPSCQRICEHVARVREGKLRGEH